MLGVCSSAAIRGSQRACRFVKRSYFRSHAFVQPPEASDLPLKVDPSSPTLPAPRTQLVYTARRYRSILLSCAAEQSSHRQDTPIRSASHKHQLQALALSASQNTPCRPRGETALAPQAANICTRSGLHTMSSCMQRSGAALGRLVRVAADASILHAAHFRPLHTPRPPSLACAAPYPQPPARHHGDQGHRHVVQHPVRQPERGGAGPVGQPPADVRRPDREVSVRSSLLWASRRLIAVAGCNWAACVYPSSPLPALSLLLAWVTQRPSPPPSTPVTGTAPPSWACRSPTSTRWRSWGPRCRTTAGSARE